MTNKKKHYTLSWDVLKAVEVVEEYQHLRELPYMALQRIYTGNLLPAVHFKKIPNRNKYGVTFHTEIKMLDGTIGNIETGMRIDEKVTLTELIDGGSVWKGAKNEWLEAMDEYGNEWECVSAKAVINCLI